MADYDINTLLSKFEELAGAIFDQKVAQQKIKPTVYATNLAEFETEEMAELNGEAPITHHKFRDFLRWLDDYFYANGIEASENGFLAFNESEKAYLPYTSKSGVSSNPYVYYGTTDNDYPDGSDRVNFNGDWYATGLYSRSLEIGNYIFYRGGSPVGSILNIRNFTDDYTIPRIANRNEVTVSLTVVDAEGEDDQLMDIYNMKYDDPKMGIRMFARDEDTTFRPFRIEYSYDGNEYQAITILPRTTQTINDTEVQIGNLLSLKDSTTWLTRDDEVNMVFHDEVSGQYTLGYLAKRLSLGTANGLSLNTDTYTLSLARASTTSAGACPALNGDNATTLLGDGTWGTKISPTDNLLKWDTAPQCYRPYNTKAEVDENAYLYYGTTDSDYPDGSGRVNFNGYWYSSALYSRSLEIGNYVFFRGGSPTGSLLNIRNFTDDYTHPRIIHRNEVVVSLSIIDSEGEDDQLMNIYNMKDDDPQMGIRIFALDDATTFSPFHIEYYYNSLHIYQAISILPRTTKTENDTEVLIGNVLSLKDSDTWLSRDDNGNMTFRDIIADTEVYTLDYLAQRLSLNTANGLSLDTDAYKLSLALASTISAGACPQLPGNTTTFFRGDGTFASPGFSSYVSTYHTDSINGAVTGGDYYSQNNITEGITVNSTGTYQVTYGGLLSATTGYSYDIAIVINGTVYTTKISYVPDAVIPFSMSFFYDFSASDVVAVRVKPSGTLIHNVYFKHVYLTLNRIA